MMSQYGYGNIHAYLDIPKARNCVMAHESCDILGNG